VLIANDLFLYESDKTAEISDVINNKLNVLENITGKTYSLKNNLSIVNNTNGVSVYVLPHRIIVQQQESTSAYFTGDDIKYINDFKLPSVTHVKESMFNMSINGEIYVVSECTNQNIIGTSMINISFDKAKLFIKSGDKYTQVYVEEGNVLVTDVKSSKKKKELKSGDYLVVTPQITLSPKEGSLKSNGNSFSIKEVDEDELKLHKNNLTNVQGKLDNTLFVNYNTNVFGVKLK
jgi:hypothetical protein